MGDVCLGVIHKVPAPGGMSAVGGTGSVYKFYDNNTLAPDGKIKEGIDGFVSSGVKETFFVNKEKSADGNRHRVSPEDGPKCGRRCLRRGDHHSEPPKSFGQVCQGRLPKT